MKYKAKIYAKALVESLLDRAGDKKIVANFLKLLERNQDFKKASEIILLAQELLLKETGNKKVVLETARKIDADNVLKHFIKSGDIVEEKINPALVAGIKIIVNSQRQLDNSLATKLHRLSV